MLIEGLLEKKDADGYRLLCEIYHRGENEFLLDSLKKWMEVSTYSFFSILNRMNEQWLEIFDEELFITSNKILMVAMDLDLRHIQAYERYLRERSLAYKMLDLLLKRNFDIDQFSENHFISLSRAYQIRKAVQSFLGTYGIELKRNILIGEEKKIRGVMIGFYLYYSQQQKEGLSESSLRHIGAMKKMLLSLFNLKPTLKQDNFLNVFLTTCEIRESQECYINDEFGRVELDPGVHSRIRKVLILGENHFENGLAYLMVFLYSFKFIDQVKIEGIAYEKVICLTKQYKQWFHIENLNKQPQFRDALVRLHSRCLFFEGVAMNYGYKGDYRNKVGAIEYQDISRFVEGNILLHDVRQSNSENHYLIREYTMLMSAFQSPLKNKILIEIVLDFSQGECFNELLRETLQNYREYDWHFRNRVSAKTDIYISDSYTPKLATRQLVWEGLPSINELKHFMEIIRQIRKEKEASYKSGGIENKPAI